MLRNGHKPPSQKGLKRSKLTKEKIRLSKIGSKHSSKVKKLMSIHRTGKGNAFFGRKHSKKTIRKMRESRKKLFEGGFIIHNKKYFNSEEVRIALNISNKKRFNRLKELKSIGLTHTNKEWNEVLKKYNFSCANCKDNKKKLTKDHIIPLEKGGTDEIKNIQPLCQSCNSKKHIKVIR